MKSLGSQEVQQEVQSDGPSWRDDKLICRRVDALTDRIRSLLATHGSVSCGCGPVTETEPTWEITVRWRDGAWLPADLLTQTIQALDESPFRLANVLFSDSATAFQFSVDAAAIHKENVV